MACSVKRENIRIYCLNINLEIFQNQEKTINSLKQADNELSYEDSYSKKDEGVEMFYFYDDKDSIVSRVELYFFEKVLQGVVLQSTSKSLSPERFFKVIEEKMKDCKNNIIDPRNLLIINERKYDQVDIAGVRKYNYTIDIKTTDLNRLFVH